MNQIKNFSVYVEYDIFSPCIVDYVTLKLTQIHEISVFISITKDTGSTFSL